MFDSVVNVWRPGEIGVWGLPYHGRVDAKPGDSSVRLEVTLPNGSKMTLSASVPNPSISYGMYGNCRVFCDPRAVDVELGEDAAEAASAAGAEWRKEELISEIGALGGIITEQLIYHDGERNWGVIPGHWPSTVTLIRGLPVIGANNSDYSRPEYIKSGTHHYTSAQIAESSDSGSVHVLDSSRDGSRHLIGLFGKRSSEEMPWRGRELSGQLYAVIELILSGPGSDVQADYYLRYSPADIYQDPVTTTHDDIESMSWFVSSVGWTTFDSGVPNSSVVTSSISPGDGGFLQGSRGFVESFERVVGAYYGAGGSIVPVVLAYSNQSESSFTLTSSQTDSSAEGIGGGGSSFAVELTSPGYHTCTVSESFTHSASLSVSLRAGSSVISSVTGSASGSRTRSGSITATISADDNGFAAVTRTAANATTYAGSQSVSHDGHSIHSVSGGNSLASLSPILVAPDFEAGRVIDGYPRAIDLLTNASPPTYGAMLDVSTLMYNAGMIALSSRVWPADTPAAATLNIGDATSRGESISGWWSGAMPARAIYGSYNPLTGQSVRDATRPVLWL